MGKEAKTGKSAEAKSQKSGAPTSTISPTSVNKETLLPNSKKADKSESKSKKSSTPTTTVARTFLKEAKLDSKSSTSTVTKSPTSIKKAKLPKSEKASKSESKSKKSTTPTITISPTSYKQAKSGSKSKAGKSTTSLAPTVTNSPTSTNNSSKQEGTIIQVPDRTIGAIPLVDSREETTSSGISNEETPEEKSAQNIDTNSTQEGRGSETNIFFNGEAAEMTDGSDQNEDGEKGVIANSDGVTDKSTETSSTTIIGLAVLGAAICGIAAGVYMKMSRPNPIDEN